MSKPKKELETPPNHWTIKGAHEGAKSFLVATNEHQKKDSMINTIGHLQVLCGFERANKIQAE